MTKAQQAVTGLVCPHCQADLIQAGVFEVRQDVTIWTRWRSEGDRWDVADEETSDGAGHYIECGKCQKALPDELADAVWNQIM